MKSWTLPDELIPLMYNVTIPLLLPQSQSNLSFGISIIRHLGTPNSSKCLTTVICLILILILSPIHDLIMASLFWNIQKCDVLKLAF